MIALSHVIYNVTLLGKKKKRPLIIAVIAGSFAPDIATAVFFLYHRLLLGTPSELIWKDNYSGSFFSDAAGWLHSLPIIATLLAFFWWRRQHTAKYFFLSWFLHIAADFFVHHSDAHMQLLPFSTWRFASPVSYWEPAYSGTLIGVFEITFSLFCLGILWGRYSSWKARTALVVVAVLVSFILGNQLLGDSFCPDMLKHFACSFG